MDALTKKTLTTKRGYTYTYYVTPAKEGKPTVLLQHGFPDSAAEWEDLITKHLAPAGYGTVTPDLLGYAGTSKPTDPAEYKFGPMTAEIVEILDAEGLDKVISLGHDWGSRMAAMMYNLRPERVSGVILVNVAYAGAQRGEDFNLDAIIAHTEKMVGYGLLWYWKLFTAEDGPKLMKENVDVFFDILHAPQSWRQTLCTDGGVRKALETRGEGFDLKTPPYATEEMKKTFVERLQRDGFEGPVCWYKSHVSNHQKDEPNPDNAVIKVPTLFIGYTEDAVCLKDAILPVQQAGLLPQLTNVTLEGAHWGLLNDSQAFGKAVTEWLGKNY